MSGTGVSEGHSGCHGNHRYKRCRRLRACLFACVRSRQARVGFTPWFHTRPYGFTSLATNVLLPCVVSCCYLEQPAEFFFLVPEKSFVRLLIVCHAACDDRCYVGPARTRNLNAAEYFRAGGDGYIGKRKKRRQVSCFRRDNYNNCITMFSCTVQLWGITVPRQQS